MNLFFKDVGTNSNSFDLEVHLWKNEDHSSTTGLFAKSGLVETLGASKYDISDWVSAFLGGSVDVFCQIKSIAMRAIVFAQFVILINFLFR